MSTDTDGESNVVPLKTRAKATPVAARGGGPSPAEEADAAYRRKLKQLNHVIVLLKGMDVDDIARVIMAINEIKGPEGAAAAVEELAQQSRQGLRVVVDNDRQKKPSRRRRRG